MLASLLVLALPACAPKEPDSQNNTDTETVSSAATPGTETGSSDSTASTSDTDPSATNTCAWVSCDSCPYLDELECACCGGSDTSTGGCKPLLGKRLDRDQGCLEESSFAICTHQSTRSTCEPLSWAFMDPDGACWVIHAGCDFWASGWTYDPDFEHCPELADYENLPPSC